MGVPTFYVRVRGKVLGPFSQDQLRKLRDRGQFHSFHEISADRADWKPASSLAGMFTDGTTPREPTAKAAEAETKPGPSEPAEWYYVGPNDKDEGPVTRRQLLRLVQAGKIDPKARVWREGMSEWQPLNDPALGFSSQEAGKGNSGGGLKHFFANPVSGLPKICNEMTPGGAASLGVIFYLVFLAFGLFSLLISGLVHKTQIFQVVQEVANAKDRFEIVAKLVLMTIVPLVSLWGSLSLLRLVTRSNGNFGADGLIAGAVFFVSGLFLPVFVLFFGVNAEIMIYLIYIVLVVQILQFNAALSQVMRIPDMGIIFAIPAVFLSNFWLTKMLIKLLFRPDWRWDF